MKQAMIMDIKRFAVHDGDGIRTTVFLKGCPLRCVWCHNPEGLSFQAELAYYDEKCMGCGECVKVCPAGAHRILEGGHVLKREACVGCGKCEDVCLGNALKLYGKSMTVEELMPILLEDRVFYENSGGGVTISGGECLMQAGFCAELLKALKEEHIHTAVDTCGFVNRDFLNLVIPYTDIFLYDMKAMEEEVHRKCTGRSNQMILDNLNYLDSCRKAIEIRIPYVPGYNSDQMEKTAEYLSRMENLTKVRILPYHNYAGSKYKALGIRNELPEKMPEEDEIAEAAAIFSGKGLAVE